MNKRIQALDSRKVQKILKYFGFNLFTQSGSHQQWKKETPEHRWTVTVVAEQKRFPLDTIASMVQQSGYMEKEWLKALDKI